MQDVSENYCGEVSYQFSLRNVSSSKTSRYTILNYRRLHCAYLSYCAIVAHEPVLSQKCTLPLTRSLSTKVYTTTNRFSLYESVHYHQPVLSLQKCTLTQTRYISTKVHTNTAPHGTTNFTDSHADPGDLQV